MAWGHNFVHEELNLMHPRRYETLILLSPNLSPVELETFKTKVEQILEKGRAKVVHFEDWGRRALAYPVKKELHGQYVLYDYQGSPATEAELKRNLKIDEFVFKHLTLLIDSEFTDVKFEEEKERLLLKSQKKDEPPREGEGEDRYDGRQGYYDSRGRNRNRDDDEVGYWGRSHDNRNRDSYDSRDNRDNRPRRGGGGHNRPSGGPPSSPPPAAPPADEDGLPE
jgi:small subunit ribosomal protein S6